ncbi:hypothetical protein [Paenibacillus graminis]|uniref:hypothetical protein n=1 Tax=Paenibacillus graminis TaxID=189425 RepID=UPI002DB7C75F|nr:hypothetical protein [Paenibacillus graminis]MEC0168627.1 hypothetical protein [Paenibacillus graminis]
MSWESVGFIFFSILEGIGLVTLMLTIFRFKIKYYVWPSLTIVIFMSLASFILRNELSLSYVVPIINVVGFMFFIAIIFKQSTVGSAIISITGYFSYGIIQVLLAKAIYGNMQALESNIANGYILQTVTFIVCSVLSWYLYGHGYGFAVDFFDKFKFKFENIFIVSVIVSSITLFAIIMYALNLTAMSVLFLISLIFFLYYSFRKEVQAVRNGR